MRATEQVTADVVMPKNNKAAIKIYRIIKQKKDHQSYRKFYLIGGTYEFVESGTCESNGFRSIQTETECSEAATYFAKSSVDVIHREGTWLDGRPTGCSWHNSGNLELWSVSFGDCDVHGYAGCFCLNPLTFE